jgi:hypothetical protein
MSNTFSMLDNGIRYNAQSDVYDIYKIRYHLYQLKKVMFIAKKTIVRNIVYFLLGYTDVSKGPGAAIYGVTS